MRIEPRSCLSAWRFTARPHRTTLCLKAPLSVIYHYIPPSSLGLYGVMQLPFPTPSHPLTPFHFPGGGALERRSPLF